MWPVSQLFFGFLVTWDSTFGIFDHFSSSPRETLFFVEKMKWEEEFSLFIFPWINARVYRFSFWVGTQYASCMLGGLNFFPFSSIWLAVVEPSTLLLLMCVVHWTKEKSISCAVGGYLSTLLQSTCETSKIGFWWPVYSLLIRSNVSPSFRLVFGEVVRLQRWLVQWTYCFTFKLELVTYKSFTVSVLLHCHICNQVNL